MYPRPPMINTDGFSAMLGSYTVFSLFPSRCRLGTVPEVGRCAGRLEALLSREVRSGGDDAGGASKFGGEDAGSLSSVGSVGFRLGVLEAQSRSSFGVLYSLQGACEYLVFSFDNRPTSEVNKLVRKGMNVRHTARSQEPESQEAVGGTSARLLEARQEARNKTCARGEMPKNGKCSPLPRDPSKWTTLEGNFLNFCSRVQRCSLHTLPGSRSKMRARVRKDRAAKADDR